MVQREATLQSVLIDGHRYFRGHVSKAWVARLARANLKPERLSLGEQPYYRLTRINNQNDDDVSQQFLELLEEIHNRYPAYEGPNSDSSNSTSTGTGDGTAPQTEYPANETASPFPNQARSKSTPFPKKALISLSLGVLLAIIPILKYLETAFRKPNGIRLKDSRDFQKKLARLKQTLALLMMTSEKLAGAATFYDTLLVSFRELVDEAREAGFTPADVAVSSILTVGLCLSGRGGWGVAASLLGALAFAKASGPDG